MSDLNSATWHELDSANTDAPPDGWPEGQPANSVNNCARMMMGATKRWYDRINATLTSGGSANAQTLTYSVAPTALVKGDQFSFIAGFTNSGAVTLNVGVGGAVPILVGASALSAGSITVGDAITVMYDGTNFQFTGWEPSRTTGQNLTVNTLTVTGSGTSVNLSAGSLSVSGNTTVSGFGLFGGNITTNSNYLYFQGATGTVSSTGGPFIYGDTNNIVAHMGLGNSAFVVQNTSGTNVHVLFASGNATHTGTLTVSGATTLSSTLGVTSNATVGGTLSVGSTATVTGALSVTGAITTSNNLSVNGGTIGMAGYTVFSSNSINAGYVVINDNAQRASIFLGSGDAQNYYRQSAHTFQSQAGGATWMGMSAAGFSVNLNATFSGTIIAGSSITASNGQFVSGGASAGFLFSDRTGGFQWQWYGTSSVARLWESAHGDRVTVDTNGSITASGNITSTSYVNSLDVVFTHGVGVIYQNIGANGFNFRWDGTHILGRVDNVVEYPFYSSNGGTISGSATLTGNLQVNGTINGNQLYVDSLLVVDQDGTYNTFYRRDGAVGIYLGGNGNNFFRNTQLNFDDGGTTFMTMTASQNISNVPLWMSNNVAFAAREAGGTARNVALMNGSNQLIFGNTTTTVVVINSGGDCTVTATGNFVVSNNDAYKPGGGSWQAISDVRVKDEIRDYEVGLEALKLRPVTYKLNGKGGTVADGREYVGLVADEVEPIMPEMVGRLDDDEFGEIKTLDSSALTFALLNVCKKLEARLAALEAK